MQKIIINEKEYVESFINSTTLPSDISVSKYIFYLTKYYHLNEVELDGTINNIKTKLDSFDLSPIEYQEYVMVTNVKRYYMLLDTGKMAKLSTIENIPIYQSELDFINKCETLRQKKMLFTIFVLAKITGRYGWVYQQRSDLYKLANVSPTSKSGSNLIHELYKLGLIKLTKKVDDNKVGIDEDNIYIPTNREEPVIKIEKAEYLGNQYVALIDSKKKMCECCGRLIRIKSKHDGSTKRCKECSEQKQLEWQRISMKKARS